MDILWHSNAPWAPTGYGAQTKLFAPRLAEFHRICVSSFYGLEGAPLHWEGVPVLPGVGGEYGNVSLPGHAREWFSSPREGMVITLLDVWVLATEVARQLNVACWTPVDHDPPPPAVAQFFRDSAAVPIAMTRFGQDRLAEFNPLYVPHAVDAQTFRPLDKRESRQNLGADPGSFIVGMVAANKGRPSRKSFQQAFEAFATFREQAENAVLYLHTTIDPRFAYGEDIVALMKAVDLPPDSVQTADQYRLMFHPYPERIMAEIYSSLDVLLNPSQGEGFGIPMLEAQACGVPVIATDFSAMSEVAKVGWKVGYTRRWTGQKSWAAVPSVDEIVFALEDAYSLTTERRAKLQAEAREHAESYSIEVVLPMFLEAITECAERFAEREPSLVG